MMKERILLVLRYNVNKKQGLFLLLIKDKRRNLLIDLLLLIDFQKYWGG